jgi:hypothetical protein
MIRLLLCAVTLFACSHPKSENTAVVYARLVAHDAASCIALPPAVVQFVDEKGQSKQTIEHGALCSIGRVLAYCHAGIGAPSCEPYADLRPRVAPSTGQPAEPAATREPPSKAPALHLPTPDPAKK